MIQYKQFDCDDDDEHSDKDEDDQDSNNSPDDYNHTKINSDSNHINKCLANIRLNKRLTISSSVNTILNNKNPSLTIKTDSDSLSED